MLSPSLEKFIGLLVELRTTKPTVHMELVKLALQAAMWQEPAHPRGCSCPLCAYIVALAPASFTP